MTFRLYREVASES